mmetsp:Transcript_9323/g.26018  ORF Transcript_9323/g.26018 Transcript_9323/m.26018 type:complete len:201 (+) Transcript_9323:312-914(+)
MEASRPPRRCPREPGTCTNPPKRQRDLAAVGDRRHSARLRKRTAVTVVLRRHLSQRRHGARPPGHARGRERSCQKTGRRRAQACPQRERRQVATPAPDHNRGRRPHQVEDWPREHPVCREQCSSKVQIGAPSGGHSRRPHQSNSEKSISTSQQGNTSEEKLPAEGLRWPPSPNPTLRRSRQACQARRKTSPRTRYRQWQL